ncbi:MAG TPA: glycosyltransferase family 39 protein [Candidatus Sulfotelmatobacter sp.]|jgi:hypothetical protein|nr:glycosyltransferase family 39 protein [Candidatus Sulfotelmatobacter sp.]
MHVYKKFVVPVLFILLLLIGFLLRSQMFLHGDFYYLLDQARDMMLTQNIVIDHKLTLIGARTGLGGLFHGALWFYLITPFFIIAKGNPFFTLVPLFELVSLGIITVGFFIGKQLYGKWMGLLFAFFLTLSQILIQTVPNTTNSQVLPIIFLFYLYSVIKFMRGKEKYFIFVLFFAGLGFQFESAFAILLIPLTLVAIILRWKLPTGKNTLLGAAAFLLAIATFIIFDIRHHFLMISSALKLFTNHVKPLPGYEEYANIGFRITDRITQLWISLFSPLFTPDRLTSALLLLIIILGIFYLCKNILHTKKITLQNKEYLFILIAPLIIFGSYIFYPLPLWPHYLLPISTLTVFILCLSIRTIWPHKPLRILIGIFFILTLYPALAWIQTTYGAQQTYQPTSDGSYRNQVVVAQWVLADAHNKPYGYFVYTTGILTYNMDYLLWYESYAQHLLPSSNHKHPITYLIMYPHAANDENAYAFWKKNVVRTTGKILLTKTFASGITVQKVQIAPNEQPADPNYYQNLLFR